MGRYTRTPRRAIAVGALVLAVGAATELLASETKRVRPSSPTAIGSTILGTAWKADNTPIPQARLRLRNVTTGLAEATRVANGAGQFMFSNVEPGLYVIELVDEDGKVLALGQVFNLGPGETVATFVRLTARAPWLSGFFTNAATIAVTAASSLGVTAMGSDGQPVSAAPGSGR